MTRANMRVVSDVANAYKCMPTFDRSVWSSETRECYQALARELLTQYKLLTAFVDVRFTTGDPYGFTEPGAFTGADAVFDDIRVNRHLDVFTGGMPLPRGHVLARKALPCGATYNSVFRAVHDGFAHYPERNDFTLAGETRAFQAHARMLSRNAIRALATETIGQNACNYNSDHYIVQKFALLPDELIDRALAMKVGR